MRMVRSALGLELTMGKALDSRLEYQKNGGKGEGHMQYLLKRTYSLKHTLYTQKLLLADSSLG